MNSFDNRRWLYVCCTLLLIEVIVYLLIAKEFIFPIWGDRALFRAGELLDVFQVAGAELNHGGRTPGGFMYYFLYVIMLLGSSPETVMLTLSIIFLIVVGWLAWTVIQTHGVLAGIITANVMLASNSVFEIQQKLFNPAISMIIGLPGIIIFFSALVKKDARYIPLAVAFFALAAQAHLSWIVTIVIVFAVLLYARVPVRVTTIMLSLVAVVVCYAPYIYYEVIHNFEISTQFAQYAHIESRSIGISYRLNSVIAAVGILLSPFRTAFGLLSNVVLEQFESQPLHTVVVFLVTGYLSALVVLYFFLGRKSPELIVQNKFGISDWTVSKALFLFVILFPALLLVMGLPTIVRYTYSIAPVGAILAGIAIPSLPLLFHSRLGPSKARGASFLVMFGFVVWATLGGSLYALPLWWQGPKNVLPPSIQVQVLESLHYEFGLDANMIRDRVLITVNLDDNPIGKIDQSSLAMESRLKFMSKARSDAFDGCFLMIYHPNSDGIDTTLADKALELLPLKAPAKVHSVVTKENFSVIAYEKNEEQCFNNIRNVYIPTEIELLTRHLTNSMSPGEIKRLSLPGFQDTFAFVTDTHVRALLLVSLEQNNDSVVAHLNSWELRGNNFVLYFNVLNPRVEFRNPEGEIYTLSLFDGNIGTKGGIVNTPWSSRLTGIPKGRYSVSFVSDDFSLFDEHLGLFRVELETDYFYGDR